MQIQLNMITYNHLLAMVILSIVYKIHILCTYAISVVIDNSVNLVWHFPTTYQKVYIKWLI